MKAKIMFSESFLQGFNNGFNLFGQSIQLEKKDGRRVDYEAIRSDWEHVGTDVKEAAKKYSSC